VPEPHSDAVIIVAISCLPYCPEPAAEFDCACLGPGQLVGQACEAGRDEGFADVEGSKDFAFGLGKEPGLGAQCLGEEVSLIFEEGQLTGTDGERGTLRFGGRGSNPEQCGGEEDGDESKNCQLKNALRFHFCFPFKQV